jgi:hypothetical protein
MCKQSGNQKMRWQNSKNMKYAVKNTFETTTKKGQRQK